eukprot:365524-Chlamydomonas_euryale.AAC.5
MFLPHAIACIGRECSAGAMSRGPSCTHIITTLADLVLPDGTAMQQWLSTPNLCTLLSTSSVRSYMLTIVQPSHRHL